MSITDWLPTTAVPTLGPGCERVTLKNDVLQVEYHFAGAIGVTWCHRTWTLVSAHRVNEAHRYGLPMSGATQVAVETANAQIRELLAEGRRMAGSMAAWVLVEPRA